MSKFYNNNFYFLDEGVLRIPLYPLNTSINQKQLLANPIIKEAIYIASPSFFSELEKWEREESKKNPVLIKNALYKYFSRMINRATPFGLFEGCSFIKINNNENKKGNYIIPKKIKRKSKLDTHFLWKLKKHFEQIPVIRQNIKYYSNKSTYSFLNQIRYIEQLEDNRGEIKYQISTVEKSIYLEKILRKAATGKTISELIEILTHDNIDYKTANYFINQIIAAKILINELEPTITKDYLSTIVQVLSEINNITCQQLKKELLLLEELKNQLVELDNTINNPIAKYENVILKAEELGLKVEKDKFFHVDYSKNIPYKIGIPSYLLKEVCETVCLLASIEDKDVGRLNEFKKKIGEIYGDSHVSLLKALDPESGVGFSQGKEEGFFSPLLRGINISYKYTRENVYLSAMQQFLLEKAIRAKEQNLYTIELKKQNKESAAKPPNLPKSMSAFFSLFYENNELKVLLAGVYGSNATCLISRFTHLDKNILSLCKKIIAEEKKSTNKIQADVLHLPEAKAGNLIVHKPFLDYEILCLVQSGVSCEKEIFLSDLFLYMDGEELKLYSKKIQKEIQPIFSSAFNYDLGAIPLYKFLCTLQTQNKVANLEFDWGHLKQYFSFLPRVSYKNIILSPATWFLKKEDYSELIQKKENSHETIIKWRNKFNIPVEVFLVDRDNTIYVNFSNILGVQVFLAELRKNKTELFELSEVLIKETPFKNEKNGSYMNEIILPMFNKSSNNRTNEQLAFKQKNVLRNFSIGSEWVYLKIYCGVKIADTIIRDSLHKMSYSLFSKKTINKWFFIRYADPNFHLRVRFLLSSPKHLAHICQLFNEEFHPLIEANIIHKIQLDTYKRELNRYGSNTMEDNELLFSNDSRMISKLINMIQSEKEEEFRWLYGMATTNQLLTDFKLSIDEKYELVSQLQLVFEKEFEITKSVRKSISNKFRKKKEIIDTFFNKKIKNHGYEKIHHIVSEKSNLDQPAIKKILNIYEQRRNEVPLFDLLSSLIHMSFNRLFKSEPRKHEMLMYSMLSRFYKSEIGKLKYYQ